MTEEYDSYCIAQAKAWLAKVRRLAAYERAMRDIAERQLEMADGLRGIDYSADRVSTASDGNAIPRAVEAHLEAMADLAAIADDAARRIAEAAAVVDAMDDPTEAAALARYYLGGDSWEQVCVDMGYTWQGMMAIQRRALLHVYPLMPARERDPLPPAV